MMQAAHRVAFFTRLLTTTLCLSATLFALPAQAGKTLDAIKQRGELICGVSAGLAGFSAPDSQGVWRGFDVDVCRAIAAAVLNDGNKVKWNPLNAQQRFAALQAGEIDVLSRNTTWTLSRDAALGFNFTAIAYYDGQGMMVKRSSKITHIDQLKNADICVQSGTTTEKNLADYFLARKIKFRPVVFENFEASLKAFFSGRCQAYTTDATSLAGILQREARQPDDYLILPELISKEPFAPVVRRGDDEWFAIVKWVVYGLIAAEEEGITQANVDQQRLHGSPAMQRLLGTTDDTGKALGLDKQWLYRAIKAVGNYGEVFDRNIGAKSPLNQARGLNKLWSQGGLLYAPPIR